MALDDLDSAINLATGEVVNNDDPMSRLDSAIDDVTTARKKRSATITSISSKFNPDEISQLRYLGKQVGIPESIAERNPEEIKRKALSQKVEQIYDTSPVLVRKMSDPAFAKINHDIIDENSKLESSVKNLSLAAKPMRAAGNLTTQTNINRPLRQEPELTRTWAEAATDPLKSFASGANTMAAGIVEMSQYLPADKLIRSALKTFAPQLDADIQERFNTTQQGLNEGAQYWQGEKSELMQQKIQQFNNAPIGEALTMLVSDPALLTDQLSQSLPYLIPGAGAARVGQVATTAYITLSEAMDAANSARNEAIAAGATQEQQDQAAARAALVTAPLVFLGNRLVGTDKLEQIFLGSGKLSFGAVNTMLREAFSGSIEEGANQLGVNIGAETTFDEGRDITQGVGKAAAIGGLLESTQGGAMAGINYAAQMMGKVENDVQQAQTTLQAFNEIQQLAAQSKLKQRSAQDFATFLQEAGGENGIDEVYVDARQFVDEAEKLGVDLNTLLQSSPVINQQLEEAIAQGTDLVIPVGEFGATIAGTDFGGAILQHLRADENGISAFEAQTQLDTAVEELQRQAETVAQKYQADEAWTQSLTEVSDNILGQLNTIGRFTPENNQAYVNGMVAPFYSTLASNLGITPSEAFARYPLQVSGQVTAEGFEQANSQIDTPEFKNWFGESKVVDADGKPLVVYHGTAADFTEFKKSKATDKQGRKLGMGWGKGKFYFASSGEAASSSAEFAEMTGRGNQKNVMPVYISIKNPIDAGQYTQLIQEQVDAGKDRDSAIALVDKSLKKQGVDGIIDSTTGGYAVFEPTQIKSAIGNRGTFDPNDANILNQGKDDGLVVAHNISAENLFKADDLGGLAVPSLGITKAKDAFEGFGDITLIGDKSLIDPATGVPVFDADAYTTRFPKLNWYKVPMKKADAFLAQFRADFTEAGDKNALSNVFDYLVNSPSYENAANTFEYSNGAKLSFLKQNGFKFEIPMQEVPLSLGNWVRSDKVIEVYKKHSQYFNENSWQTFINGEEYAELSNAIKESIKTTISEKYSTKPDIVQAMVNVTMDNHFNENGLLSFGTFDKLGRDISKLGKQEVDTSAVSRILDEQISNYGDEYLAWAKQKIRDLFDEPYIEIGKKKASVNLQNVVDAMTTGSVKARENTMTYGAGKARAAMSKQYKTIEEIQAERDRIVGSGHQAEIIKGNEQALEDYRLLAVEKYTNQNWRGEIDTWAGLDDSMRVLADIGKVKNPSDAKIAQAFKKRDFNVDVNSGLIDVARKAMIAMRDAPVDYLEAKPQRAVMIGEFSGAVVPNNVDPRVLEVLQKNGVKDIRYYDESTPSARQEAIGQFENLLFQKAEQKARGQISFSNDITQGANITLLKNADASTFIHELGHFFLEVYADVASKPDAPQSIVDDMNQLFNWFGIESTEQPALDVWRNMTIDQKRFYHEKLARGFEQYAMEGNAPTLELSRVFAKLRSFMLSAYKSLKQFFERSGDPGLTKEVRQVFDRMLAADEAINKAQAVRGMMPMFASMEEAGMSIDEYAEYLQNQQDATDEAKAALTARSLRDMKWLQGARSRVIRDLQRQADTERRAVRMQVRREVMTQPVYQAYSWLKQIPDETKAQQAEKVKATKGVDVEKDSLYTAIAKLGGLNRQLAASEWGLDPKDRFDSGVFGKPVLRKEGGLSVDQMAEALSQYNYLTVDESGKWDLHEFEDKFFEEARGEKQYSLFAEGEQYRKWQESIYDDQERARLDAFGKGKLDLNSMKAMYGEEGEWRNLGIGRTGMVMTDGVAPDAVAELFGFNSGDQLVKTLLAAENPKELIDRLTDERMLAEFSDLVDARKVNEAADKAVHNEVRARVLATELSAQNKALGNRRLLDAAAKEYANRQVAKQLVRDLKPSKYTRAESKSAQLAEKATKQGDTQTAVQAKRDQLLNNRAAKATVEAIDKIESTLKYLKKFDSEGVRKNLDIEYLEQIDDILSRFDLRSGQSLKAIDKRKSLLQWVESQKEIGLSPVVDEDLLNEARLVSYKDLPFEQFMALADSIKNIEHLGRLKKTLLTAKDKREFAERMAEARESINNNANRIVPERATPNDFVGKLARFGRRFSAAHRKFSSFMRELDGGKDLGVMQDMLLYSMYEAGSLETDLRAKATEDLQLLFAQIEGKMDRAPGNLYAVKRVVPGTNISLTHEQRIMFAMNWGNDGNRQRLLDGGLEGTRSISNEDAAAILDTITKEEWDFIQGVWDYIATYKPMIAEQELRLTGREPVWIEPSPVNTKFGTYAGGYFPAKYDAQMSTRSESLEAVTDLRMAMKGAFNASGTRDGYTQARAEAVKGRPILLSFDTISRHIHEVTHRLAWQEWLTDATRVIKALDADIREKLGAEALQEMHQHIRDVAIGDAPVTGTTDVLLSRIRNGTSIVGMGYRVSTALMQPSGIFQSWARLGINATANGVKTFLKNPVKTHQWIMENSPMMRNRASTLNREINEIVNQVRAGKNLTRLQASYFYLIGKMQMMIDTPTYIGAYEKALADLNYESAATEDERQSIEKKAHLFAGQTVIDTQTGGEIKDLAGVQKGSQGQKLFTNFYSYFSALYNLNVENFRAKKLANPAEFADFVATALLLNVMPVIYTVALKNLLKGECNWDDTECLLSRYKSEQMGAIFGQMIGVRDLGVAADVATGGDAYGYSGPPSLKFFSEIYKFGQQADQGDIDMPMFKALNNAGGILFHYPAGQINTTIEGMLAIERGEVDGVNVFSALISGPPKE